MGGPAKARGRRTQGPSAWCGALTRPEPQAQGSPLLHELHLNVLADHLRVRVVHEALQGTAAAATAAPVVSVQRAYAAGLQRGTAGTVTTAGGGRIWGWEGRRGGAGRGGGDGGGANREQQFVKHKNSLPVVLQESLLCHVLLDDGLKEGHISSQDVGHCERAARGGAAFRSGEDSHDGLAERWGGLALRS